MVSKVQIGVFDDPFPIQSIKVAVLNIFLRAHKRLLATIHGCFTPGAEWCLLSIWFTSGAGVFVQIGDRFVDDTVALTILRVFVREFYCLDLLVFSFFNCFS